MGKGLPLAEDPVERRRACEILVLLSELRDDLLGRLIDETWAVGDGEEAFLLRRGQPMGDGPDAAFPAVPESLPAPILDGSPFQAQDVAGLPLGDPGLPCFVQEVEDGPPVRLGRQASLSSSNSVG
jgi:hypothetical protein